MAVLSIGTIADNISKAIHLSEKGDEIAHFDMRFVKPLDEKLLHQIFEEHPTIITIEDGIIKGGFGSAILEFASNNDYTNKIKTLGVLDTFIEHGNILELHKKVGLDAASLAAIFKNIN